jgi:molybdate transport system substrate-binding protein
MLLLLFTALPGSSRGGEIRLSAAASLTDAVRELAAVYRRENPGTSILFNFGASGSLARQIARGAPADIFISANPGWMEYLVEEGRIGRKTVRQLAANSLVFIGLPALDLTGLADLTSLSHVAIGSPQSVPAGRYAEQALRNAGVHTELVTGKKLVLAKDVRQALLYAERGEADGALVYRSDALLAVRTTILFAVPQELHEPVLYPAGLTAAGSGNEAALSFFEYLAGSEASRILNNHGFLPPSSGAGGSWQRAVTGYRP